MELPDLAPLRAAIDTVDREILSLLQRRLTLVYRVGDVKRAHDAPIYDPERERVMLDRIAQTAQAPLDGEVARRIFRCIIEESRNQEQQHVQAEK